ncbi:hypothetical protein [Oleiagrimonas sp.]|jgi:hypothetical protein|uniref:hypothetical protein n=1 Tax=Oleiagrimonas sp. TaxID=2010330 RepID=UPI002612A60B|nr:hypothetical protein [Oleiagrimonas sp.]MDA3912940.1 hypothetical protein [Oleiagrimonas sp.]
MNLSDELKIPGFALPVVAYALKWLRKHHDCVAGPPAAPAGDHGIESLVCAKNKMQGMRTIRRSYHCNLKQAQLHDERLRARMH